jgi:glycosyltransferase involved in cell wall biosynthesis
VNATTECRSNTISIALCTYNGAPHLQQQLDSLVEQEILPNELIISDDASTDETLAMVRQFSARAPFPVKILTNAQRLGVTKNFEKAISSCSGGLIALCDQDDIWKRQKLAVLRSVLTDIPEAGYAFSNAELVDVDGLPTGKDLWSSRGVASLLKNFPRDSQVGILAKRSMVTGATVMFRSCLRSLLLPMSPDLMHDFWIAFVSSAVGMHGIPIQECLIKYRQHNRQQIGVESSSILAKLKRLNTEKDELPHTRANGYRHALERILEVKTSGIDVSNFSISVVRDSIEHLETRAKCRSLRRVPRWGTVLHEAATGRYSSISNSWRSIARDLFF